MNNFHQSRPCIIKCDEVGITYAKHDILCQSVAIIIALLFDSMSTRMSS